MRPSWTKPFRIYSGTVIVGKWNKKSYTIMKELGYGANGVVYLANGPSGQVAIKFSDSSYSISSEVNVLKAFEKVQSNRLGPSFLDVDDWETNKGIVCFYVMEYIHGPNLLDFIAQKGTDWVEVLMLQILTNLQVLHENNWIFGDLKPDNLLVSGTPPRLRCIDVGGTTQMNRAIKEFTEFFDRGYWGLGSRKAEVTYDLFAVAMVWINLSYPNRFQKLANDPNQLERMVIKHPELVKYQTIIVPALYGKFLSANEMKEAIIYNQLNKKNTTLTIKRNATSKVGQTQGNQNSSKHVKRTGNGWKVILAIIAILGTYSYYLLFYLIP